MIEVDIFDIMFNFCSEQAPIVSYIVLMPLSEYYFVFK